MNGTKCIDISDLDSLARLPADVVPVIEHRQYSGFPSPDIEMYQEGIFFRDQAGHPIINYPKQHLRNGRTKDDTTDRRFKPVVRVFKNARYHCDGFDAKEAPSYYVECLVYNIDHAVFRQPLPEAYPACVRWLYDRHNDLGSFKCQNGLTELFGDGRLQWRTQSARRLIEALVRQLS